MPILIKDIGKELKGKDYEIILVDDGSTDGYKNKTTDKVKIFTHKKRFGKGQALRTGIDNSSGETIVFMDGDLQDDPRDLAKMLKKIDEGYGFVNGVRVDRKDNALIKFYSSLATGFLKKFLHSPYTDINCGFKAFKRDVINGFVFYGNNFRFFPLRVFYNGNKVTEVEVRNNRRRFGQTKFGSGKLWVGIFDTLTAYFLYKFSERPLHFFGSVGSLSFLAGSVILIVLAIERIFFRVMLYRRPILFLGMLLVIVGIQIVMTGIIGELIVFLHKKGKS